MTVTAKYFPKTLADHLAGFLAANGVKHEPFSETSPFFIKLAEMPDQISLRRFKDYARELKRETGIQHSVCLEFMARSYGYKTYGEAVSQIRGERICRR